MESDWQRSMIPQLATATILGLGAIVVWFTICVAATGVVDLATERLPKIDPYMVVSFVLLSPALLMAAPLFDRSGPIFDDLVVPIRDLAVPLLVLGIVSWALAVICYVHHRRYDSRAAIVWAIYVLVMGVPGAIGYWLHRRWPPTERCPRCGIDVPCDRETCLQCGTAFPLPSVKGNEIFDAA